MAGSMGRPRKPMDATAVRARLKDKGLAGWQRSKGCRRRSGDCAGVLPLPQIAEEAGVSARTIGSWFAALRDGGIERLPARPPKGKGPACWLDERTARELQGRTGQRNVAAGTGCPALAGKQTGQKADAGGDLQMPGKMRSTADRVTRKRRPFLAGGQTAEPLAEGKCVLACSR